MSAVPTFYCAIPSYRPVGGVIKALDYTLHARAEGIPARVLCPQPVDPDSPLFEIPGFEGLLDDPMIKMVEGLRFAPQPDDWVFFSLPSQWPAISERLPAGFPTQRVIHIVQGVRHANPSWQRGYPMRLLARPMTRVVVSEPILDAIRPHLNPRSRTALMPLGHRTEYFESMRDGFGHPVRVAYTTWKSDVGEKVEAQMSGDRRFTFRHIEGPATWEELRELYQWADVFLSSPSHEEGFYLPGLEAMAAGAVVITPDVYGNRAYCRFGENCYQVPHDDEEACVAALEDIVGWDASRISEMRLAASREVARHRLDREGELFSALLDELKDSGTSVVPLQTWRRPLRHDPAPTDLLLTGVPRSGTTLVTHLLNQLPDVVALSEPLRPGLLMREPSHEAVVDRIVDFLAEQRIRIRQEGVAESRTVGGSDPDNYFEETPREEGVRRYIAENTELRIDKALGDDFTLIVKDVVMLTALLPVLMKRFRIFGMIRNPLAILASWNSVQFNIRMGHSPHAEWFDPDLGRELSRRQNRFDRQLELLSWWFERIHSALPSEQIIQYEEVVESDGKSLAPMVPAATSLSPSLMSRNANVVYDEEVMETCAQRLLASDGSYWEFYDPGDIQELLEEKRTAVVEH